MIKSNEHKTSFLRFQQSIFNNYKTNNLLTTTTN